MNRKCLLLLAVFLYFSLCVQSVSFSQVRNYSRKIDQHTDNWEAFNKHLKQEFIDFEKGERQKRDSAKKQAQLEFLRESLKLAQEHITGKQDTSSEFAESVDIKDETGNVSELDIILKEIANKAELLSNKVQSLDDSYLKAIANREKDYLINRTNALHKDYINVIIHFEFEVDRYDYVPGGKSRRQHDFVLNETYKGIDNNWYLKKGGFKWTFKRTKGDEDPELHEVSGTDREWHGHFLQRSPKKGDHHSGTGASKNDVTFTLILRENAIKQIVSFEIEELHKAVQQ